MKFSQIRLTDDSLAIIWTLSYVIKTHERNSITPYTYYTNNNQMENTKWQTFVRPTWALRYHALYSFYAIRLSRVQVAEVLPP